MTKSFIIEYPHTTGHKNCEKWYKWKVDPVCMVLVQYRVSIILLKPHN